MENKRKGKSQAVDVQGLLPQKDGKGVQINVLRPACFACGQLHPGARLVHLPDGRSVGSYSDEYRVYCEAKWVLRRYRTKRTRQVYLQEVANVRGEVGYNKLRNQMLKIWAAMQNKGKE